MSDYYKELPESLLIEADQYMCSQGDIDNNYARLLRVAAEFKAAEMTPMFLADTDTQKLMVVAKETWKRLLH